MEIIKVKNEGYAEYEELLLRREQVRKEARQWQALYMEEFGDLVTAVFEKKVSCIKLKKTIGYCQADINRGKNVDTEELNRYINQEMQEYQKQLKRMVEENEAAHNMTVISDATAAKIKKLYHKLAKMMHPDINPMTDTIPELKNIWHMITVCYNANDLEELQEAEVLAERALRENNITGMEVEIPDLKERIQKVRDDIYKIEMNHPYQYKYLLSDYESVEEKKKELQNEFSEYENYERDLKKVLEQLMRG